jgi:hypothetical protein
MESFLLLAQHVLDLTEPIIRSTTFFIAQNSQKRADLNFLWRKPEIKDKWLLFLIPLHQSGDRVLQRATALWSNTLLVQSVKEIIHMHILSILKISGMICNPFMS